MPPPRRAPSPPPANPAPENTTQRASSHPDECAAPGDTGTERAHENGVAGFDLAVAYRFVERDGDRGARGVAVALDVDDEALHGDVEPRRHLREDAQVGLMGNHPID